MDGESTGLHYSVEAELPDEATRDRYVSWLLGGHIQAVVEGGAALAEVIQVSEPAGNLVVQTRYRFPDRAAFDQYVAQYAPRLREEGRRLFPPESGVRFSRQVGTILGACRA